VAVADLKLEELIVVKPTGRDYAMAQRIRAMSLPSALGFCQSLRSDCSRKQREFLSPEHPVSSGAAALLKLTSSFYVDSEPIRRDLGWSPGFTMEEGLRRTLAKRP
jgi:hypothetical protein